MSCSHNALILFKYFSQVQKLFWLVVCSTVSLDRRDIIFNNICKYLLCNHCRPNSFWIKNSLCATVRKIKIVVVGGDLGCSHNVSIEYYYWWHCQTEM